MGSTTTPGRRRARFGNSREVRGGLTINSKTDVRQTSEMRTMVAVTTALSPLCAPLSLFTALRLKLPVTG